MRIKSKFLYYGDIKFLIKVFIASLKISILLATKGCHSIAALIPFLNTKVINPVDKGKINKYVNLCVFILRKLGIRYTCFSRSILLCYILRQEGIEANVNFGARKIDGKLIGHCWVRQDTDLETISDYQTIFRYP